MSEPRAAREDLGGPRLVQFGAFELRLDTRELRKHGVRLRLQGKPFNVLKALLEEPGRVVTRDELRNRLWPANTFVDFESGLNTAVNRLRIALGDSAENPSYIETLARLGYRFIAPVVIPENRTQYDVVQEVPAPEAGPREAIVEDQSSVAIPTQNRAVSLPNWKWVFIGTTVILAIALAWLLMRFALRSQQSEPAFHQVTFRRGFVTEARFTPDGGNIIYSAGWNGEPARVFLGNTVSPEARDLGLHKARLASLSSTAELAVFVRPSDSSRMVLERIPLNGGAPRVISEYADGADWAPDGSLCVVTEKNSVSTLEFPAGRKLYVARGYITNPRVSPRGNQVAFIEHPVFEDDAGQVVVVNSSGEAHVLSSGWGSAAGLAWSSSGREVWFTATRSGANRSLMAVDLGGRLRQISRVPGDLQLKDIAPSGRVLIARSAQRMTMLMGDLDDGSQRDISWFDWSRAIAIRADGKAVLFDESGEGGGKQYGVYLYQADANSTERLGPGRAMDLSADGQWALTQSVKDPTKLTLVSAKAPQSIPTAVPGNGIAYRWAKFFPDGKEILFAGSYPKQSPQIYRQHLPDGAPVLITTGLAMDNALVDPTGRTVIGCDGYQLFTLNLENRRATPLKTPEAVEPVAFVDSKTVLVSHQENGEFVLELLDLRSGKAKPYSRFKPPDTTGTMHTSVPRMAKDLQTFVYSQMQNLSDLFIVTGWN